MKISYQVHMCKPVPPLTEISLQREREKTILQTFNERALHIRAGQCDAPNTRENDTSMVVESHPAMVGM
jgi:hypothetical protein